MKKHQVLISVLFCAILIATFSIEAHADGTTFYGINIGYGNAIIENGENSDGTHRWYATHSEYTTFPYYIMSQLGATVWTTYGKCGNTIYNYSRYESQDHSWMLLPNSRSYGNLFIYKNDVRCSPTLLSNRHNDVVHYWQSSQYPYPYGSRTEGQISIDHDPSFSDVPLSHWAYLYIEAMYQIRIMDFIPIFHNCTTYNSFCPDQPITRGEMAYFL